MVKKIGEKSFHSNFDKLSSDFGSFLVIYVITVVYFFFFSFYKKYSSSAVDDGPVLERATFYKKNYKVV